MSALPSAIVRGPWRPSRKLAIVAASVVVAFAGWRGLRWCYKYAARDDTLAAQQNAARHRIGDGLDELFDAELDARTKDVELVPHFTVDGSLGDGYDAHSCAQGFDAAFADAEGSDAVYPGIVMTADVALLGKSLHIDVQPSSQFEFEHETTMFRRGPLLPVTVAEGLTEDTCKQVGYALARVLTTKH